MAKSGVRAAKAAATRARMLAAARSSFVERGYTATTMQAIADAAGVAVQTVYFTFATKRAILSELVDVEVAGDSEPIATLERPWVAEALAAPPKKLIELLVTGTARIHERVVPVLEVVRSAAGVDPEIGGLWRTNIAQRHTVLTVFAGALAAKTALRANPARAADIMLATLAPESYHLLVHERGWSREEWAGWAAESLVGQLVSGV